MRAVILAILGISLLSLLSLLPSIGTLVTSFFLELDDDLVAFFRLLRLFLSAGTLGSRLLAKPSFPGSRLGCLTLLHFFSFCRPLNGNLNVDPSDSHLGPPRQIRPVN